MAKHIIDEDLIDHVEFSDRTSGFKINVDLKTLPDEVSSALKKCSREMVSTYGFEKSKLRFRFLPCKLLSETSTEDLKALLQTLDSWTHDLLEDLNENHLDYADQFYAYANTLEDKEYTSSAAEDSSKGLYFNPNLRCT